MVEFAFVLPLLLTLVLGVADFGLGFNYFIQETHLANEAARYAVVDRNPGGGTPLQQWVKDQAEADDLKADMSVVVSYGANGQKVGEPITVTTCFDYDFIPWMPNWVGLPTTKNIKVTATMRIERLSTPPVVTPSGNVGSCT